MKWAFRLFGLLSLGLSTVVAASDVKTTQRWQAWPTVGSAQLDFLFFDVYTSELKAPHGRYTLSDDVTPHPIALSIHYQRNIAKAHLLKETRKQWLHLGYKQADFSQWEIKLATIYPEIKKGDRLVYVSNGSSGVFYYYEQKRNGRMVGKIEQEAFNDAFVAIWLSPKTEYPDHRAQLIGLNQ